jgi:hypothetical protein
MIDTAESDNISDSWYHQLNQLFKDDPIGTERVLGTIARIHEECQRRLDTVDKTD